ncbi:hypothetical protein IAQ61_004333 [Plenodomus lingam]|nr:hypothetical protein IAQ61_004333 [Plenodomus lingam]
MKVVGKDCTLQCDWTALQAEGFEIHAFLPKPTAIGSKVSNHGAFVSIDGRPISSRRGTVKQMVTAFKARLRKMSPSVSCVKDPFICVNIVCPPDSYDPNIEPAKDDVMFENDEVILDVFNRLLNTYYPETAMVPANGNLPVSAQQRQSAEAEVLPRRMCTPTQEHDADSNPIDGASASDSHGQPPWRSSMYGIDEDDMHFIQDGQPPIVEEEEGVRAAEVSNPWTIARMNAAVKPRRPIVVNPLLSPAKSQCGLSSQNSTTTVNAPRQDLYMDPLTPQSLSKVRTSNQLDDELVGSITYKVPHLRCEKAHDVGNHDQSGSPLMRVSEVPSPTNGILTCFSGSNHRKFDSKISGDDNIVSAAQRTHFPKTSISHQKRQRRQVASVNKPYALAIPATEDRDTWFGQPMAGSGSQSKSRQISRPKVQGAAVFSSERIPSPRRRVVNTTDRTMANQLYSEDNTNIRDFFVRVSEREHGTVSPRLSMPTVSSPRRSHREISESPGDLGEQLRAYAERASPTRASSLSATSILLDAGDGQVYQHSHPSTICMQPSFMGNERQSPLLDMPAYPPTVMSCHRNEEQSGNSKAMEAHFKNIEARETLHLSQHIPSIHTIAPRIPLLPKNPTKPSSRRRRRTTDGLERTKSSRLPLERVPRGYHIQNLIQPMQLTIATLTQATCNLDMRLNSLEWGRLADADSKKCFAEPALVGRVTMWTVRLDGLLDALFGRRSDVDTICLLHEGVQRGLEQRNEEGLGSPGILHAGLAGGGVIDGVVGTGGKAGVDVDDDVVCTTLGDGIVDVDDGRDQSVQVKKADDGNVSLDMSQFLNLDADVPVSTVEEVAMPNLVQSDEEFAKEIDDDMLLEL